MWKQIIRQTVKISVQQDFYNKKWLFDIILTFLFLMASMVQPSFAVKLNVIFLIIIAMLGFGVYTLYERCGCSYLYYLPGSQKVNILLLCCLLECIPYLLVLVLQMICCFTGKWYIIITVAVLEFLLAIGVGIVATYAGNRIGRLLPVVFFGFAPILTWEQLERLHVITPAALLYNLDMPNNYSIISIAGIVFVLFTVIMLLKKEPKSKKRNQIVAAGLLAGCLLIGAVAAFEYRFNNRTEKSSYSDLEQGEIVFLYKGMGEEQAKRLAFYLNGFFGQLEQYGFEIPNEIILEKYIGGFSYNKNTYYEYNPVEHRLKVVITSNAVFNERGEQLSELILKTYLSFVLPDLEDNRNEYAKEWLLYAYPCARYQFAEAVEEEEYTAYIELCKENYEIYKKNWEKTVLGRKLLEMTGNSMEDFYKIFMLLKIENPQSETELMSILY